MHRFIYLRFLCLLGVSLFLLAAVQADTTPTADQTLVTAQQLLDSRQDQQAAVALQGFLTHYPQDARAAKAAFMLGRCYQHLAKYDKAVPAFEQADRQVAGRNGG